MLRHSILTPSSVLCSGLEALFIYWSIQAWKMLSSATLCSNWEEKYNPTFSYPFDFILNSVYMVYFNKNITIQYNRPTQEVKLTISWKTASSLLCLSSVGHLRSWVSGLHGNRKRFSLSPAHQQQLPAVNFFQFLVWNCHHELLRFSTFNL